MKSEIYLAAAVKEAAGDLIWRHVGRGGKGEERKERCNGKKGRVKERRERSKGEEQEGTRRDRSKENQSL